MLFFFTRGVLDEILNLIESGPGGILPTFVECLTSRWPPVWEIAVHLAVAGGVFDGVFCVDLFSH